MSGGGGTIPFPERSVAEEEAARWVVRISEAPLGAEEALAFEAWRRANPRNAELYARMRAQWDELGALGVLRGPRRTAATMSAGLSGQLKRAGSIAAVVLVAASLSGLLLHSLRDRGPAPATNVAGAGVQQGRFSTLVGEQRKLAMEDGSRVTLNTASQAEVRLTPKERRVRLEAGEAFFEVAPEAERPFRVYTQRGIFEAIGTAFSVRIIADELQLVVEEGRVSFTPEADDAATVIHVLAGQSATFGSRQKIIETLPAGTVDQKLSWLEGTVVYSGEPLKVVVQDISRYTDVSIAIADPELEMLRVGGYFQIGDVDGLLASLEEGFKLRIDRQGPTDVLISQASE